MRAAIRNPRHESAARPGYGKSHGIGVRPDQRQIWAASNVEGKVFVHSLPDLKPIGSIEVGDRPSWIAFTPDSRYVYVTTAEPE